MAIIFFALIIGGFVGGAIIGHFGARAVGRMLGQHAANHVIVERCALAGSIAVVPVVAVVAFLGGGNIGGGAGAFISESIGAGSIGAPFGIATGIALVMAAGSTIGGVLGAAIGYILALAFGRHGAG